VESGFIECHIDGNTQTRCAGGYRRRPQRPNVESFVLKFFGGMSGAMIVAEYYGNDLRT
jgi:hypothetical protein